MIELNPGDSSIESSGIPGSPNTPVKKVMSKTHCARKYLVSLLCEMSLVGEQCTFNVENHPGPRAKLQSILEKVLTLLFSQVVSVDPVAAKCNRYKVVMQQTREFRSKYSSCCLKMASVK